MRTRLPLLLFALPGMLSAQQTALTIYNTDFAVVRDEVPLDLKAGVQTVAYDRATATLEPESVILRDPSGKQTVNILEQSYRNDPATEITLLSRFEGKELEFLATAEDGTEHMVKGSVVRAGRQTMVGTEAPIIEVEGKQRFSLPGQPLFPALADDTILRPRLEWKVGATTAAKFNAEVAYLTTGMSWEADYNLIATEKGDTVDLIGWVTMENRSGKPFFNASVKLMAGELNKVEESPFMAIRKFSKAWGNFTDKDGASFAPVVTEKIFDEYHLYTLQHPITLRDSETKQVEFVRATGVKAKRLYIYDGLHNALPHGSQEIQGDEGFGKTADTKVAVVREFKNTKENGLGLPLPKGKLRFYLQDGDQRLEFTGENTINHTPRNETVRVTTGYAFDIIGERRCIFMGEEIGGNSAEEKIEIKVRNRKSEAVEVTVKEHLVRWANWEITETSAPFTKKNAQEVGFQLALKPDEEGVITYTVRYTTR